MADKQKPTDTDALRQFDDEQMGDFFVWLDALRESGAINMWGAGTYLMEAFELEARPANAVVGAWMRTFGERHGDSN